MSPSSCKLSIAQFAIEKFATKLFGESEVETALQRLDQLIRDEIATTLSVVLGHVYVTRKVTESMRPSLMGC